jgi:Putative adhesin
MPTYATPEPIVATVEVAGAQVRVTASERTDTTVLVEPIDTASPSDRKVAERTTVDFAGGRLSVKTTKPGDKRGSVAITIELPAGSDLAAYLAHSSVQVGGPVGRSELHLATGQVRLDRVDSLKATIASGEVAIGHIAGRADVDGGAFRMRIGEVEDAVVLSSSGGQVWIGHARADLDLGSASGDFDIDRADGSVTANTASGAIRIGRMTRGRAKLMNSSGNIEVGIGEGAAASIDVNSERGAVHNFVSSQAEPGGSDPKVAVFARTRHGDIIIQRAQRADRHEASVTSTS